MNDNNRATFFPGHGEENVLQLAEPESYLCRIPHYSQEHGTLGIFLYKNKVVSYLSLSGVRYFQGPFHWTGALLRTASEAECRDLIAQAGLSLRDDRLFIFNAGTPMSIKILANSVLYRYSIEEFHKIVEDDFIQRVTLDPRTGKPWILKTYTNEITGRVNQVSCYVDRVLRWFAAGHSHEEILLMWPHLDPEDIQACLVYARRAISKTEG
jgi:hypothetical protein